MQIHRARFQASSILTLNVIMAVAAVLAVTSLIIEIGGFAISGSTRGKLDTLNWIIISVFVAESFIKWGFGQFRLAYLRRNWPSFALIFLFLVLLAITQQTESMLLYIVIVQLYILGNVLLKAVSTGRRIARANLPAAQIVAFSFLFVILVGTGLLLLPRATEDINETSFLDALFTSTSATCVTGLIVVDTGTHFSRFGQIIILILIQIGGLGLMTTTAFFSLILGRGISVRESVLMSDVLSSKTLARISSLIVAILTLTIIFEAIGVLAFWLSWSGSEGFEHGSVFYYSLFHSISAFCNAGFSLFSNSFEDLKGSVPHNLTLTALIVIGGLGFTVIMNLFRFGLFKQERLSLQTKLVLTVTPVLLAAGAGLVLITEWNNSLADLPIFTKIVAACFQSVTPRTAGFNTINIGSLTNACYFLMMILMFIGASPGSTGGGIKTSTFGIFLVSIWSMLKGRNAVEMFKRDVPRDIVNKALSVIILAFMFLSVFGFVLLFTEKGFLFSVKLEAQNNLNEGFISEDLRRKFTDSRLSLSDDAFVSLKEAGAMWLIADGDKKYTVEKQKDKLNIHRENNPVHILFELVSAFGTVGLSAGITSSLTTIGKIIIIVTMFIGRIGPLTLALAVGQRREAAAYEYPEEAVMIG